MPTGRTEDVNSFRDETKNMLFVPRPMSSEFDSIEKIITKRWAYCKREAAGAYTVFQNMNQKSER